ncbi:hypothetical protein ACTJJ0_22245 [Chitinophaga sp. 22321]|uniref:hypothetical protein n=1 Tax=Chitinophaga sp. 22321 TaxID=3453909 RepID=UPI003F877855
MPNFEDYSKDGELLQVRYELLNTTNFARYIKVEGKEKAEGYIDALDDLTAEIDKDLLRDTDGWNSPHAIGRETRRFVVEKVQFVNLVKQLSMRPDVEKEFSLNLHTQSQKNNSICANRVNTYISKNQTDRIQGYLECMGEITQAMESSFITVATGNYQSDYKPFTRESSTPVIGNNTTKLYKDRVKFLEFAKEALSTPGFENTAQPIPRP